jgi:CubicO group peptidase (beta-lactamase class C family)
VNERVFDFFPGYAKLDTGLKSAITIRHLLTMSSGLMWNEGLSYDNPENSSTKMIASGNTVEYVLSQPMELPPGKVFNYNGGGTQLLAAIIEKATGKQIDQFADEHLFKPLGIKNFSWSKYPGTGIPMAAGGLRIRSRDMLKIALLYANRGSLKGNQIIPARWIAESFQSRIKCTGQYDGKAYGYHFWLMSDTLDNKSFKIAYARGNGDQRIYFDNTHRLIVIVTAGNYNNNNIIKNSSAILKDYIYPALIKR